MSISYLERYQNGEYMRVWTELLTLGPAIREPSLYAEAQVVAREIMTRAKHNITLLVERLNTLGYRFVTPDNIWNPPDQARIADLDRFEQQYGPLPLSLRMWYELIGPVNFMGAHPKLSNYYGHDWGEAERLGCYTDPLVIAPFPDVPYPFYIDYAEDDEDEITGPPYGISLAPDAALKANHSGGGALEILFPNPAIDAPLISEDWDGLPFVSYLRTCFRWGGFPGMARRLPGQSYDPENARAELAFLTKDLLWL
jgi:hypothetical protein